MRWIPVTTELPKDDSEVLISRTDETVTIGMFWSDPRDGGPSWTNDRFETIKPPLAWQPKPTAYNKGFT